MIRKARFAPKKISQSAGPRNRTKRKDSHPPDLTTNDPQKQNQEQSGGVAVDDPSAGIHATIVMTPLSIPALTWPARIVRSLFALKQVAPGAVNTRGAVCFWFLGRSLLARGLWH
jgi:hypothetical protein